MTTIGPHPVEQGLAGVHDRLVALVVQLDAAVGAAKDTTEVAALLGQIDTLNAQVTAVGQKVIDAQTAEISDALSAIADAQAVVVKAVKTRATIATITDAAAACISKVAALLQLL